MRVLADRFRLNENLIEVYPRATLELLGLSKGSKYKKDVDKRVEILARLPDLTFAPGVWREECRKSDHLFDAVICAYTGYLWSTEGWRAESADGLLGDGWIWVPPERAEAAREATGAGG
jgi:predicted RNase H-like nuclease